MASKDTHSSDAPDGPDASDPSDVRDALNGSGHLPFAHLTTPNAGLYRQVMGAFVRAKDRFAVHLRPEDVHATLPPGVRPADTGPVTDALDRLVEWGNLRADPDTTRVTAVEDFYRRRFIYQLTRAGEAAEAALALYDETLGRRGSLQAVALADIVTHLRVLLARATEEETDPAAVHLALLALVDRFTGLAENARAFMGSLQRTIDLHDAHTDAFLAYKDRLIEYLERFIQDLITIGAEIAGLLGELEQLDDSTAAGRLLRLAARREAADVLPEERESAEAEAYERWRGRWEGLRAWFLSTPGRPAQSKLLRTAALAAIPQLLAVVASLNERRAGRSDRSADFRALALWFAEAPDDDARHRLWRTAFGLYPARHLAVDAETLAEREERPVPASTPWAAAPPLRISPQLRKSGSYERRGKARKVTDRGRERRHLAELARKQSAEIAAARARLATDGPVRLSELGELDPVAFGLFLQLLGYALATWRPGTARTVATSNDGTMEIRLGRPADDGRDRGRAEVRTPGGVFRGPDHSIEIIDLTEPVEGDDG